MQLGKSIPCCPCRRPDDLVPEQLAPATSYAARALAERRFLIYVSPNHPISCKALRAMRDLPSMCHVIHIKVQEDINSQPNSKVSWQGASGKSLHPKDMPISS